MNKYNDEIKKLDLYNIDHLINCITKLVKLGFNLNTIINFFLRSEHDVVIHNYSNRCKIEFTWHNVIVKQYKGRNVKNYTWQSFIDLVVNLSNDN